MNKPLMMLLGCICGVLLVQPIPGHAQQIQQIAYKTVPNLIGLTADQGIEVCQSLEISCKKTFITAIDEEHEGNEGKIVTQSPASGKRITSRQDVTIVIYSPEEAAVNQIVPIKPTEVTLKNVDLRWDDRAFFYFRTPNSQPGFTAWLKNGGKDGAPANSVEAELQLFDKDNQKIFEKLDRRRLPLGSGETHSVNIHNIPLSIYQDTATIRLIANPNDKVPELNSKNNTLTIRNLPDLEISRIWVVDAGHYYSIRASIDNVGTRPIPGNFSVTWTTNNTRVNTMLVQMPAIGYYISDALRKSEIPVDQSTVPVKLHINDGIGMSRSKIHEELSFDNNILEVELDLPDK